MDAAQSKGNDGEEAAGSGDRFVIDGADVVCERSEQLRPRSELHNLPWSQRQNHRRGWSWKGSDSQLCSGVGGMLEATRLLLMLS